MPGGRPSVMSREAIGRACVALAIGVLLLGAGAALGPAAHAAPVTAVDDRAASLQAMLDRILGPGGAHVQVMEQVTTSPGTSTSVRHGRSVAQQAAAGRTIVPGVGSGVRDVQRNAVNQDTTTLACRRGSRRSGSEALLRPS